MTQHQEILNYMREHGSITKMDGFSFGCTKVDTRISELRRAGYHIDGTDEPNKKGNGSHKRYTLVEDDGTDEHDEGLSEH